MEPPIYYDTTFPYIHLSLERIAADEIHSIRDWIDYLIKHAPQGFHQIDMDASHPLLPEIISSLLTSIPYDERLSYIHIKQTCPKHFLTSDMIQELLQAVHANINNQNITIQVTYRNRVVYH